MYQSNLDPFDDTEVEEKNPQCEHRSQFENAMETLQEVQNQVMELRQKLGSTVRLTGGENLICIKKNELQMGLEEAELVDPWKPKEDQLEHPTCSKVAKIGLPNKMNAFGLDTEIWDRIFDFITDPKDWLNCSRTCTLFQEILHKKKKASLLPQVIEVLNRQQKRINAISSSKGNVQNVGNEQLMGNVELTPDDLRTCRLVCKSWRTSINNYVSHHPSIQDLLMKRGIKDINYGEHFANALPIVLNEKNGLEKATSILTYLDTAQPKFNLLSSRHLVLKGFKSFAEHGKSGKHPFVALLEKVGSSIWHFAVDNEADEFDGPTELRNWWDDVIQCLHFLPNLRSLVILQANRTVGVLDPRLRQVPHFPDLTVLQVIWASHIIYTSVLKTNNHVEKLTLGACGNRYEHIPSSAFFKHTQLSKLKQFSFSIGIEKRYEIPRLRHVKWPVTKFAVSGSPLEPQRLIRYLLRFKDSLTHFYSDNLTGLDDGLLQISNGFPDLSVLEATRDDFEDVYGELIDMN